jgi:hypothetical protein
MSRCESVTWTSIKLERLGPFIGETMIRTSQDCVDDGLVWSESILEGECARDMHSRAYVTSAETKDSQVTGLAGGSEIHGGTCRRFAQMAGTLARQTRCQALEGESEPEDQDCSLQPMRPRVSHRTALLHYCPGACARHLHLTSRRRLTSILPRDIARCPCDSRFH